MEILINEELLSLQESKDLLIRKIKIALLPKDPRDDRSVMLEIRAGAGGNEACIWAGDLARMYERYGRNRLLYFLQVYFFLMVNFLQL